MSNASMWPRLLRRGKSRPCKLLMSLRLARRFREVPREHVEVI